MYYPAGVINITLEGNVMTQRINTAAMTNEELVDQIQRGVETECAYQQLFINLKPIILGKAQMYRSQMINFDTDDFLQEGYILVWKIISNGRFKGGKFANYYISAIRRRYIRGCLKNKEG